MGILSFLKRRRTEPAPNLEDALLARRQSEAAQSGAREAEKQLQLEKQREIARATAAKIDAIEAAMTSDIFNAPEPPWQTRRRRTAPAAPSDAPETELLFGSGNAPFEIAALVEDIAILYANEQVELVEDKLVRALADEPAARAARTCWAMLLDYYQIAGQQARFDNLAIDYASKFETFPPLWSAARYASQPNAYTGVIPTLALPAVLDLTIAPQLERIRIAAPTHAILRIECVAVEQFDAAGCHAVLTLLRELQAMQRELILVGAAELVKALRSQLHIGQRDAAASPWLLLLEILRLSGREKDYRETAVDYRVTYNESAAPFEKPQRATVADAQNRQTPGSPDRYMMPATIDHDDVPALLSAIQAYAAAP
ncbi:MAG TPA: STAS domain-containing protein, partial [Burkholderiaceae bacterium]